MSTTKQIPRDEWQSYFDRFTRMHLGEAPETVTIEIVHPQGGDQYETQAVRLLGLSYDPRSQAFEVLTEDIEHLAFSPEQIWVVEDDAGFISALSLNRPDGTKEILYIQRGGPPATLHEPVA